jgi:hypothetical protein
MDGVPVRYFFLLRMAKIWPGPENKFLAPNLTPFPNDLSRNMIVSIRTKEIIPDFLKYMPASLRNCANFAT